MAEADDSIPFINADPDGEPVSPTTSVCVITGMEVGYTTNTGHVGLRIFAMPARGATASPVDSDGSPVDWVDALLLMGPDMASRIALGLLTVRLPEALRKPAERRLMQTLRDVIQAN